jgi:hypothetical protein
MTGDSRYIRYIYNSNGFKTLDDGTAFLHAYHFFAIHCSATPIKH